MPDTEYFLDDRRGVVSITGDDAPAFLQGLISNDIGKVTPERAIYAALLTPQGRFLHDFFIAKTGDTLLLDCEGGRRDDLIRRLTLYRLRAKVTVADASESMAVAVIPGAKAAPAMGLAAESGTAKPFAGGVAFVDPRTAAAGVRAVLPRDEAIQALAAAGLSQGDPSGYERARLSLGLPDGSRDLPVEKALLMENRFEELNGLDWDKGCYVGQELTARMKYRALVKKRLLPVRIDGPVPAPGTPVTRDGKEVGEMRSAADGIGLALLRVEAVEDGGALSAGEATVTPAEPEL